MCKALPFKVVKGNSNEESTTKVPKVRKPVTYISDNLRLTMLLMITHFGLSCYMSARVLNIPYENAKMIYRGFRVEKRIIWNLYNPTGLPDFHKNHSMVMLSQLSTLKDEAKRCLLDALNSDVFTIPQKIKIYQQNFDEFIYEPSMSELSKLGFSKSLNQTVLEVPNPD